MGYWNMASLLNFLMFLFEVTRHCLNMEILKKENPHHYLFFLVSASCDHFSFSALFFSPAASSSQSIITERRGRLTTTGKTPAPCCWLQITASLDTWAADKRVSHSTTWSVFMILCTKLSSTEGIYHVKL